MTKDNKSKISIKTKSGCCNNEVDIKFFCRNCHLEYDEESTLKIIAFELQTAKDMREMK